MKNGLKKYESDFDLKHLLNLTIDVCKRKNSLNMKKPFRGNEKISNENIIQINHPLFFSFLK